MAAEESNRSGAVAADWRAGGPHAERRAGFYWPFSITPVTRDWVCRGRFPSVEKAKVDYWEEGGGWK